MIHPTVGGARLVRTYARDRLAEATAAAAAASLLLSSLAIASAPEPTPPRFTQPGARTVQFPTGLYDESTPGSTLIRLASERARAQNKRVLVMWGENNCGFCAYLSDLLFYESDACRGLIDGEYELVKIDIAKTHTKHNDLARKYGVTQSNRLEDAPRLTIIDPVTDRGLASLAGSAMLVRPMTMERVFDETILLPFLEANVAPARPANSVLEAAVAKAIVEDKPVWVQFTQGACAPCTAVESWMEGPDAKPLLSKSFVVALIDANRMTGGRALLERLTGRKSAVPPVSVLLDSRGTPLDPPALLDALPTSDDRAAEWTATIRRAAGDKRLPDADAAKLAASLKPKVPASAPSPEPDSPN
ncbi:MAG: hypothetical protein KF768_05390 [Phycisphaeraceae bacterium]|nr:hypothetical protein [Phycisphaeraceae bacterium]